MKKFSKLIPALCMLVVSAVLLGTSTYAWFSMNKTVTASGLQITAKSDFIFLLAGEKNATLTDKTAAKTAMQANPDAYKSITFSTDSVNTELAPSTPSTSVTDAATAAVPGNWYTANSTKADESQGSTTNNQKFLTEAGGGIATDFDNYVIHKTVFVTLAKDSKTTENNLKVKVTLTANNGTAKKIDAIKVLATTDVSGKDNVTFDKTGAAVMDLGAITADGDAVQIDFYIYYDGTDDSVRTNNFANLDGAAIAIEFSVS